MKEENANTKKKKKNVLSTSSLNNTLQKPSPYPKYSSQNRSTPSLGLSPPSRSENSPRPSTSHSQVDTQSPARPRGYPFAPDTFGAGDRPRPAEVQGPWRGCNVARWLRLGVRRTRCAWRRHRARRYRSLNRSCWVWWVCRKIVTRWAGG